MRLGVVVALATAALLAAGAHAGTAVVVTRGSAALPAGCSPAEVAGLLQSFADAEARGDLAALDGLFAPAGPNEREGTLHGESGFVEYSVTDRAGRTQGALERSQLRSYFVSRHALHESLRFVQVAVFPKLSAWPFRVDVNYVLRASADDLGDRVLSGKGQINCASGTIPLLQIDLEPPGTQPTQSQCPEPAGWTADGPLLACAMRPSAWAVAPDFRPARRTGALPRRCGYESAVERLSLAFGALDAGSSRGFAGSFARSGVLVPWRPRSRAVRGRRALVAYAVHRIAAVDGWTLTRLETPRRRRGARAATYRLTVRVAENGAAVGDSVATLTLDCRSGLIDSLARA